MRTKKKELINFYVPSELKTRFDGLCNELSQSRTSALSGLMNDFVMEMGAKLTSDRAKLDQIDSHLNGRNQPIEIEKHNNQSGHGLPVGFCSNDDEPTDF